MRVRIVNVDVENVQKGQSRYSKATVAYIDNGQAKTQNVMSFGNPAVFKAVKELVGQEVDVTVTKNDAGYNQWSAIAPAGEGPAPSTGAPTPQAAPAATRVTGSNFETPAERATKQVYIIKQSSLSNAIELAGVNKEKKSREEIIQDAQVFTDWVLGNETSIESLQSDPL